MLPTPPRRGAFEVPEKGLRAQQARSEAMAGFLDSLTNERIVEAVQPSKLGFRGEP